VPRARDDRAAGRGTACRAARFPCTLAVMRIRRALGTALPLLAAAACGHGPAAEPGGTPAPAAAPAAPPRTIQYVVHVAGTELRFVDRGSGTAVVFVHGSLGTLDSWRPQLDAFAARFHVIAYSRRYHPPNPARPDGEAYTLARHADDLIALIEARNLGRVHLVGSDYGAYIALLVTLERPDLVRSLVLAEPSIIPWLVRTPDGDSLRRAFETRGREPARAAFARGDTVEAVRRFVDALYARPGRYDALSESDRVALLRSAFALRLEMRADPATYMPPVGCKDVGGIRNSVLVVTGERSPRLFHVIDDELARCLSAKEILVVPGAGHDVNADNPAYYNAAVLSFLSRN
jgi:non-heme chloroperoxidase